ncbi:MAG: tetratricopeptide repeat protein [Archangiaceae bacterium]|nr:tetratricopeptide repeat protein [Archangiaceae bacterium]
MLWAALLTLFSAAVANPYLDQGRALARELQFDAALEQLKVAREVRGMSLEQAAEVRVLLARCHVALGQRAEAEEAFAALLELEPSWAPEAEASPKLLEAFDAAKEKLFPPDFIALRRAPAPAERVRFELVDPWARVQRLVARVRRPPAAFAEVPCARSGSAVSFELGPWGDAVEWTLELRGEGDAQLRIERGARPSAEVVEARAQPGRSTARRAAGWVGLGVAAAAAIGGAVLQAESRRHAAQAGDTMNPPGEWVDSGRQLHDGARLEAQGAAGLFLGAGITALAGGVLLWF